MLIAFEGVDGSGKATQAHQLQQAMWAHFKKVRARTTRVHLMDFPAYDRTNMGPVIKRYLKGEMGALYENHPFLASLPYSLDRFECRRTLVDAIDAGDHVICDRYVHSNVAHQCAKIYEPDNGKWEVLASDIEMVEYEILRLPKPDLVIYLDLTAMQSYRRTHTRDDEYDIHQDGLLYMAQVRNVYIKLAHIHANWHVINCFDDKHERTVEAIHDDVCGIVFNALAQ